MSLPFGSMRVFISNYVFYSFGLILRYFFRFLHLGDTKKEINIQQSQQLNDGNFHDSKIDGFSEELANFLFWSEEFHERETEYSVFMDTIHEGKTEYSVLKENHSDFHEESVKTEVLSKTSDSKEIESHIQLHVDGVDREKEDGLVFVESKYANLIVPEDSKENEGEEEDFVIMETDPNVHETETKKFVSMDNSYDLCNDNKKIEEEIGEISIDENETECSVFMENVSVANQDGKKLNENEIDDSFFKDEGCNFHDISKKIDEIEKENYVFSEDGFNLHDDSKREEETEQKTGDSVFMQSDTITTTTTSKCEFFSGKDISIFMEEPTKFRFSFREFYASPDVSYNELSSVDLKKDIVHEEEKEESIHETDDTPIRFESEVFGGTDSSEEDYFLFNENSVTSDSESESSSSSGLILSNINKVDDSFSYHFLGGKNGSEGFESEILNLITREEKQSSFDDKVSNFEAHEAYSENEYIEMEPKMKKNEETKWEDELNESESDEDDFEWEHDDLVEQLKLELKNSRQGGLATIIEEVEEEFEENEEEKDEEQEQKQENEFTNVVEEFEKQLKIEEKVEYMDQMDEIEIVYKSYAEKMKKLDILNYQTMHALGLLQLKDPLKLTSIPKSTILNAKNGIISHTNLWPRKPTKITSDPFHKIVDELHRDLELVYVGQMCLSWEILCWQHMKAIELQEYDSQGSHHRYNHVAGEFQLFQVLMQRFVENEPFQSGPRIQNYVKNRCVIRNLLHVPAIKDDIKGSEEDATTSGKLQDIIKESMRMFWEFVRADKDNGNVISKHIGFDLKDPAISGLLVDIKTQLQKKDRKLKDIVRTGNCIVKKFQKHHEDQLDHEQLVAQVGLKLISRVVNMSQLRRDQVLWCSEKLHRIKFLSRKIVHVEPSFLLFPC